MASFLAGRDPIPWAAPAGFPRSLSSPCLVFAQKTADGRHTPYGLEVVFATAAAKPTVAALRKAHKLRREGRPTPVLVVVAYPASDANDAATGSGSDPSSAERVALCGPGGQSPPVLHDIEPSQAERLAATALDEPDRHAAERMLAIHLHELEPGDDTAALPIGVRNNGLLATHHLGVNVPARDDWDRAVAKSRPLLLAQSHARTGLSVTAGLSGTELVERLGYTIERRSNGASASLLTVNGRNKAVAVFCHDDEPFDSATELRGGRSPVETAIGEAERHNLDWVILTRKAEIRLYAAKADTGVGRKGRGDAFVELNLALLPAEHAGYLHLLFSAEALGDQGSLAEILENSALFAADLAGRLRERVYFETVPALAQGVAAGLGTDPSPADLEDAYEQVMVILFRLLFVAYAEDKELLPCRGNDNYRQRSLKQLARGMLEDRIHKRERFDSSATSLWTQAGLLWRAVDKGDSRLGVPAYNGGLFAADSEAFATGAALARMELSDADFGPALAGLLIDETPEGEGLVDFRSLSVREFGTIYEGLLESRLALAETDLTVRKVKGQDMHAPAKRGDKVVVRAGEVYLHNRSGDRKATGSYFTKPFAVEHLLDEALEPALDDHLARLDELRDASDEAALAKAFFDFRCADIAMGSGHFLVAALDRVEARLSKWLEDHPLPAVTDQLDRLHATATAALGAAGAHAEIERSGLLRRQVARHCVYGVDRQPVAVELARLAVWIHTFVPGLPLSFLDHNLVCGDSLTGVGSLEQAAELLETDADLATPSMKSELVRAFLERAQQALDRLAITADANKAEIEEAREAHREAREKVAPAEALFDLVTAHCVDPDTFTPRENFDKVALIAEASKEAVRTLIERHRPLHFPAVFPEVFLRDRPGFDCLLGNPPWEKIKIESKVWWGRFLPGIRSQSVQKRNAAVRRLKAQRPDLADQYEADIGTAKELKRLLRKAYPSLGPGDTDLYRAFAWRFWQLAADPNGRIGIVLPRTAVSDAGNAPWRLAVLGDGQVADVTVLANKGKWVFEDVHGQYTVSLCSLRKGQDLDAVIKLSEPFLSLAQFKEQPRRAEIPAAELSSWSTTASFPLLPSPASLGVFRKMKSHPRVDRDGIEGLDGARRSALGARRSALGARRSALGARRSAEPPAGLEIPTSGRAAHDGRQESHGAGRWRTRPVRELDATADRQHFVFDSGALAMSDARYWPVYAGESFNLWNPDTGKYYASARANKLTAHLFKKRKDQHRKGRSAFSEFPKSVIDDRTTLPCLAPRIAFRDVTRATDTRSVVAALVPGERVITHQAPYLLRIAGNERDEAYLLGVLSSMILDWYARTAVELHLTFAILNSFPIPEVDVDEDPVGRRVVEISGRLAAVDERHAEWAEAVGVPVGSVKDEITKSDLIHELDACVALLYGLDEDDLAVIYETFSETVDYSERHAAVLAHFRRWRDAELAEDAGETGEEPA